MAGKSDKKNNGIDTFSMNPFLHRKYAITFVQQSICKCVYAIYILRITQNRKSQSLNSRRHVSWNSTTVFVALDAERRAESQK